MRQRSRRTMLKWFLMVGVLCLLVIGAGEIYLLTRTPGKGPQTTTTAPAGTVTQQLSRTSLPNCVQPPTQIDWQHISAQSLARYGLPARPLSLAAVPAWLALLKQFKHRSCSVSLPTTGEIHATNQALQSTSSCQPGMSCQNPTWAGALAEGDTYRQVQATWTLPCLKSGTKNTTASAWVGLGGVQSLAPLVQAGIDASIDSQGQVLYNAWAEAYIPPSATQPFQDHQVILNFARGLHCNDQIYAIVLSDASNGSGDSAYPNSYFLGDATTGEYAYYNPDWPASDGTSVEWIVEQPAFATGQQLSFKPLADFGTLTFSLCTTATASQPLQLAGQLPLRFTTIQADQGQLATATARDATTINVTWLKGS